MLYRAFIRSINVLWSSSRERRDNSLLSDCSPFQQDPCGSRGLLYVKSYFRLRCYKGALLRGTGITITFPLNVVPLRSNCLFWVMGSNLAAIDHRSVITPRLESDFKFNPCYCGVSVYKSSVTLLNNFTLFPYELLFQDRIRDYAPLRKIIFLWHNQNYPTDFYHGCLLTVYATVVFMYCTFKRIAEDEQSDRTHMHVHSYEIDARLLKKWLFLFYAVKPSFY